MDNPWNYYWKLGNSTPWAKLHDSVRPRSRQLKEKASTPAKPECEVVLGYSGFSSSNGMFSSSSTSSVAKITPFMHWLVDFKIGSIITRCEAHNVKGQLTMRMESGGALPSARHSESLGHFQLEFADIMTALGKMGKGGKYSALDNNCQKWIMKLLTLLGIPIPDKLRTVAQKLCLKNQLCGKDGVAPDLVSEMRVA
ncbi:uncharacterized protein LOC144139335 [Haemaphysalis longicornis]